MRYLLRCLFLLPLRSSSFKTLLWLFRSMRILPAKAEHSGNSPTHLLVVNLTDFIGDTVMMMPLLDRLHAELPKATIDVVISAPMASYVREIPYLRNIVGLRTEKRQIPIWSQYWKLLHMFQLVRRQLRGTSYDLCFLPRWGTDPEMSSFLASMTGARWIIGNDPAEEIETRNPFPGASELLSHIARGGRGLPEAVRELRLIEACGLVGGLDVQIEEHRPIASLSLIASRIASQELRTRFAIADTSYMILAPGASSAARRWAPERFAKVALELHENLGIQVLILGASTDSLIGKQIADQVGPASLNLVGRTNLAETTALLSGALLLITNDSGPAHIGAGLGVITLVLSPCPLTCSREVVSSPLRVRPVGPAVRILQPRRPAPGCADLCLASTGHCILGITVEQVILCAKQMIAAAATKQTSMSSSMHS